MIAFDTNVIVCYLVKDDPHQAEAARLLLQELTPGNPGFICREVVLEIAWVLERSYRFSRAQVAEALIGLTASDTLVVENSDEVAAAAYLYDHAPVGFSDLMVFSAAKRSEAAPLYTFDRRFARMEGATLVEHAQ